ncbi:MAG: hypothetical protein WD004_04900 [Actinomycetota bacterium]
MGTNTIIRRPVGVTSSSFPPAGLLPEGEVRDLVAEVSKLAEEERLLKARLARVRKERRKVAAEYEQAKRRALRAGRNPTAKDGAALAKIEAEIAEASARVPVLAGARRDAQTALIAEGRSQREEMMALGLEVFEQRREAALEAAVHLAAALREFEVARSALAWAEGFPNVGLSVSPVRLRTASGDGSFEAEGLVEMVSALVGATPALVEPV